MFSEHCGADADVMESRDVIRRIQERSSRGATFVEYALLTALFTLMAVGSLQYIFDTAKGVANDTAQGVSRPPVIDNEVVPGPSAPAPSAPHGGGAPTTTTTQATTTTAQPTTTSTTQATTTTTTSTKAPAWASSPTTYWHNSNQWRVETSVQLFTTGGVPLPDGAQVEIRMTVNGSPTDKWVTVRDGRVEFSSGNIHKDRQSVTITVRGVRNDGGAWNGQTGSSHQINRP